MVGSQGSHSRDRGILCISCLSFERKNQPERSDWLYCLDSISILQILKMQKWRLAPIIVNYHAS